LNKNELELEVKTLTTRIEANKRKLAEYDNTIWELTKENEHLSFSVLLYEQKIKEFHPPPEAWMC
jgi:predicted  nucleic acid-binding Zn-ribbon protein